MLVLNSLTVSFVYLSEKGREPETDTDGKAETESLCNGYAWLWNIITLFYAIDKLNSKEY